VPVNFTHNVSGSFPICSLVDAAVVVALTGKVTGIGAAQLLPLAEVKTAPTILEPLLPCV
jgi:hypothetical protein